MRRTSTSRSDELLLLRSPTLHFGVAPANRAPLPVIGHWHAAFCADTHALCGFRGFRRKQAPEKRHCTSPVRCPSDLPTARGRAGSSVPEVFISDCFGQREPEQGSLVCREVRAPFALR